MDGEGEEGKEAKMELYYGWQCLCGKVGRERERVWKGGKEGEREIFICASVFSYRPPCYFVVFPVVCFSCFGGV